LRRTSDLAALGGKTLHIDVECLGKTKQDAGGHRTLVALEMVEIGSGNAKLIGHLALVEPTVAAKPLEPGAEEEFPWQHSCMTVKQFTEIQVR